MDDSQVLTVLGGFAVFFLIIGLVLYLLDAISTFKYLKVRGYESSWMAFIPFVNVWATVEATYGKVDKIKVYGWNAPAVVIKLWALVTIVLAGIATMIPSIGSVLSTVIYILNVAVLVQIYQDTMERLEKPQEIVPAVIAILIAIISDIMILGAAGKFQNGQIDYSTDERVLQSQIKEGGLLSFLNSGK